MRVEIPHRRFFWRSTTFAQVGLRWPVDPEDRGAKFTREKIESDRLKYLAYWLTLSARDRERVPKP